MEDLINTIINRDPRSLYLNQLGSAIRRLVEKDSIGTSYQDHQNFINDIHKKAMEVINTIPNHINEKDNKK